MRSSVEMMEAVEAVEHELQPLTLKSDRTAQLATEYRMSDAQIALLHDKYIPLVITDVKDKDQYSLVHTARINIKDLRIQVEKTRKDLVADSVDWQRVCNAEAKRITGKLDVIETHLEAQEAIYNAAAEQAKAAKKAAEQAKSQGRIDALTALGVTVNLGEIIGMTDEAFFSYLSLATQTFNAEKAKKEAEEAERIARLKEETDRLETQRKANEEAQAKLDAQAAKMKAQQDEMDAKQRAIDQAARDEQIRKDAEASATAKALAKIEADRIAAVKAELEAKAKAEAEAQIKLAIEAARPDAEKLSALSLQLSNFKLPEMATASGREIIKEVEGLILKLTTYINSKAKTLTEIKA